MSVAFDFPTRWLSDAAIRCAEGEVGKCAQPRSDLVRSTDRKHCPRDPNSIRSRPSMTFNGPAADACFAFLRRGGGRRRRALPSTALLAARCSRTTFLKEVHVRRTSGVYSVEARPLR